MKKKYNIGITFGTFDLFHIGHLRILQRSKALCNILNVGISTDKLNFSKKNFYPVYPENERLEIVQSIKYVDNTFYEESLEDKIKYIKQYNADILFMGDDWLGKFDFCKEICDVVYLSRTTGISTTQIIQNIKIK